jgi:hypothetical protein
MAIGNFPTGSQGNSEKSLFTGQGYGAAQVFSPDYEGMLATKKGLQDEATAKQEKADAGAYGVLGDLSKLSGALPGHADRLGREKIAFMERFKEDVKSGKHVNDPSWLPKKKAEAEFLIAGYKDSNDTYKNYMKLYEDVVKNPSAYDPKAIEDFKKILDPTSYSEFEDNIPAMVANAQQRMMNLQQKPKVELFDLATDPSFKSWKVPVKDIPLANAGMKAVINEEDLGKQARDLFESLPDNAKKQLIVTTGDPERAVEYIANAKAREAGHLRSVYKNAPSTGGSGSKKNEELFGTATLTNTSDKKTGNIIEKGIKRIPIVSKIQGMIYLKAIDPESESTSAVPYTVGGLVKRPDGNWSAEISYVQGTGNNAVKKKAVLDLEASKDYGVTTNLIERTKRPINEWDQLWEERYSNQKVNSGKKSSGDKKQNQLPSSLKLN